MEGYGFVFAKNIGKNVSRKYSKKLIDHAKNSATDAVKLHKKMGFQKQQKQLMILLVIKSQIK